MADSLVVDSTFELLGGGVDIQIGETDTAQIRLDAGWAFGQGVPQQTFVSSLLLDGERPSGTRTGNATLTLPVLIRGTSLGAAFTARDRLVAAVSQQTWELIYTPEDVGFATVFDCFRAQVTTTDSLREQRVHILRCKVDCQRLPYGRSDELAVIDVPAPPAGAGGGTAQPIPLFLDGFETPLQAIFGGTLWIDYAPHHQGTKATQTWGKSVGARTFPRQVNLTNYSAITLWVTTALTTPVRRTIGLLLGDRHNRPWPLLSQTVTVPGRNRWVKVTFPLARPPANFDRAHVALYWLSTSAGVAVDDMNALAKTTHAVNQVRGGVYRVVDVDGSARAPADIDLSIPDGTKISAAVLHRPPTEHVPENWTPLIPVTASDGSPLPLIDMEDVPTGRRWHGSYDVVLAVAAIAAGGSRTASVTFTQYYNDVGIAGGTTATATVARSYVPADVTSKYLVVGRITLPLADVDNDNTALSWTVGLTASDNFTDILLLDTRGQTIVWSDALSCSHIFIDAPDPMYAATSRILGGGAHETAVSRSTYLCPASGGPFGVEPDTTVLCAHTHQGAPQMTVSYAPRWRTLRSG